MSTYNILYINTNIFKQFNNETTITINVNKDTAILNVPLSKCLFINNNGITNENAHEQQFMYFANKPTPTTADDIVNYSIDDNIVYIENSNNDNIYMCIQGITDDGNIKFIFDQHMDTNQNYGLRWSSNYNVIFKLPSAINTSTYKLADNNSISYQEVECICVSNNIEYISIDNVITLHQTNKHGVYKPPRIYAIGTEYDNYTYSFTVFTNSNPVNLGEIIKNKMEITPNEDEEYNYNIYQPNIISYEDRYKTTIHKRDYRDVFIVPINDTPTLDISNTGDLNIYLDKLGKDPSYPDETLFNNDITLTIGEGSAVNIVGDISDLSDKLAIELNGGTITYNGKEINEVNGPELYFKTINSNIDTADIEPHPKLSLLGSLTSIQNNLTMIYNTITDQLEQGRKVSTITGESYDTGFTIGALSYDVKQYIESLVQPNEQQTDNIISYDYNVIFSVSDTINIDNKDYSAVVITIDNTDYNVVGVFNNQFATLYTTGNDSSRSYHYVYTIDRTSYVFDTVHTESDIIATVNNKLTYRSKQVGYYTHNCQVNRKQSFMTTIGDNIYFVSMV